MSWKGQADAMTEQSVNDMLERSALFGMLEPAERLELADKMRDVELEAGQVLFSRGDPGDCIYLVMLGRISHFGSVGRWSRAVVCACRGRRRVRGDRGAGPKRAERRCHRRRTFTVEGARVLGLP